MILLSYQQYKVRHVCPPNMANSGFCSELAVSGQAPCVFLSSRQCKYRTPSSVQLYTLGEGQQLHQIFQLCTAIKTDSQADKMENSDATPPHIDDHHFFIVVSVKITMNIKDSLSVLLFSLPRVFLVASALCCKMLKQHH